MKAYYVTGAGSRSENQDAAGFVEEAGELIACVCDGLGGHTGGALAANAAKEAILRRQGGPAERIAAGNQAVLSLQGEFPSMRTTAVVLSIAGDRARWAHCGDSRLYLVREGTVEQLTLDHSVSQALARMGEIASCDIRGHEDRARLTRALGAADAHWDEGEGQARPGDLYLLMSDGFWEPVLEEDMAACACDDPQACVKAMEALLLRRAQADQDNYTALAVCV